MLLSHSRQAYIQSGHQLREVRGCDRERIFPCYFASNPKCFHYSLNLGLGDVLPRVLTHSFSLSYHRNEC